jgi:hypothetical protein
MDGDASVSSPIPVVGQRSDEVTKDPRIAIDSANLDAGMIPLIVETVKVTVGYANTGGEALKILNARGSCSCFRGLSGDLELKPNSHGKLLLQFDKHRMPVGAIQERLIIETNDPAHRLNEITVKFFIQDTPARTDLGISPSLVSFGRRPANVMKSQIVLFRLTLPLEDGEHPTHCRVEVRGHALTISGLQDFTEVQSDGTAKRTVTYRLSWTGTPADGCFEDAIKFFVSRYGRQEQTISVPVSGDALDVGNIAKPVFHSSR